MLTTHRIACIGAVLALLAGAPANAQQNDGSPFCGNDGVWIQILGGGGPELDDDMASASYLLFVDNRVRLVVDTAPGSSGGFDRAGGDFADVDALVYTQLGADHASDFPAFVAGSASSGRDRPLPVIGPDGAAPFPDTVTFVRRMIGPGGAFAYLADYLTLADAGYRVTPHNVPASGRQRQGGFGTPDVRLSAIPVHHGPVPALAWRADVGDQSVVFTGDFSNRGNVMPEFAKGADALVIHHAVPEGTRGSAADLHVTPSQIGRIASQAGVRMVVLGHRMKRTRGVETITRGAIEEHYDGSVIFANDMECWGL